MNHGPILFLGVLAAVVLSWFGLVVGPHFQFGRQETVAVEEAGLTRNYPLARSGEAAAGAEVYRANGCYYCHTQLVRARGEGSDLDRGWGPRRTVARDYLRDRPVMLGQARYGPDLANLGGRETNAQRMYLKLYNPRIVLPGSTMPRFPYLFDEKRRGPGKLPDPDALKLPPGFGPGGDVDVVPRPEARALVAYLASLKAEPVFYEVFPTPIRKGTNLLAAAGAAGSTNAGPATVTNAPAAAAATNAPQGAKAPPKAVPAP
jgi:cytochrome c oxidase cbb3-type subunit 2